MWLRKNARISATFINRNLKRQIKKDLALHPAKPQTICLEPVNFGLRLAVLKFSQIFNLNCYSLLAKS